MSDWIIYGLREKGLEELRYIGLTTVGPQVRMRRHGYKTYTEKSSYPVHNWIRSVGIDSVEMVILEECPEGDLNYLYEAEAKWERDSVSRGHRLKNAVPCGSPNPRMKGDKHPLYGVGHTNESRAKISKNHADVSGSRNPNFGKGKSGADNSQYGIKHSEDRIRRMMNGKLESLKEHKKHERFAKTNWDCPWCCYSALYGVKMSDFG